MSFPNCPICLQILIEPVLLPCNHCYCKSCFGELVQKSNLQCALCRRRIGTWARLNSRNGTLVSEERWEYIQKNYPREIKARREGKSTPRKRGASNSPVPEQPVYQPGEVRREYQQEMEKFRRERQQEEEASQALIKQILEEEERENEAAATPNESSQAATLLCSASRTSSRAASVIQEPGEMKRPASAVRSASRSERIAFKRTSKTLKKPRVQPSESPAQLTLPKRSSSIDSITGEFSRHFKPIARFPRTPPHQDNKEKGYPETIKVTPGPQAVKRIDFASSCSPPDTEIQPQIKAATTIRDKPLTDISSNIPSSSNPSWSQSLVSTSTSGITQFAIPLPLQSTVTFDKNQLSSKSNKRVKLKPTSFTTAVPTNDTSTSDTNTRDTNTRDTNTRDTNTRDTNTRDTNTPVMELTCCQSSQLRLCSPISFSPFPSTSRNSSSGSHLVSAPPISPSSESMPDTASYRSETSASNCTTASSYKPPPSKVSKLNHSRSNSSVTPNDCISSSTSTNNGMIKSSATKPATNCSSSSKLTNGAKHNGKLPMQNGGHSTRATRSVTSSQSKRSNSTKTTYSVSSSDMETETLNTYVQSANKQQDDILDALYASKLQKMYNDEDKYKLNGIRCPGSGNEYNTRTRNRSNRSNVNSNSRHT